MSRRSPVLAAESRPSLSRGARMALSYLALFVFTAFALYPISRIVTIALRPGDQLLSSSLAFIPHGATLANFRTLIFETLFLRWLGNSLLIALAVTITESRWPLPRATRSRAFAFSVAAQRSTGCLLLRCSRQRCCSFALSHSDQT